MEAGDLLKIKRYGRVCGACHKRNKVGVMHKKKFYCSKCRPHLMPVEKSTQKENTRDTDYYYARIKHLGIRQEEWDNATRFKTSE